MKLRIFVAVILLALIAGAGFGLRSLQEEYARAQQWHEGQLQKVQELEDQAVKLQEALDSMTLEEAQSKQAQAEELNRQLLELKEQMETLGAEMEAMNSFLEENQDAAAQVQEELSYLQGVYDALEEGLKKVEGYIAGN